MGILSRVLHPKASTQSSPNLESNSQARISTTTEPLNVVLTGSTGNLGSYMLDNLLNSAQVGKVYCLNRSAEAASKQVTAHQARGLATSFPPDKVAFVKADFPAKDLGLHPDEYKKLAEEASLIIHNAWVCLLVVHDHSVPSQYPFFLQQP